MKKPNRINYFDYTLFAEVENYINDLERYCDYLRNSCSFQKILKAEEIFKEDAFTICSLERALDKACYELDLSNKQLIELDNRFIRMNKDQWKEYLMRDE